MLYQFPDALHPGVLAFAHVLAFVVILYVKEAYFAGVLEVIVAVGVAVLGHAVPAGMAVYPSSVIGPYVGDEMPLASSTAHCLITCASVLEAADALALSLMLVKDGMAIAAKIASTATTTTSSISEKPASPGLVVRACLVFGSCK